MEEALLYLLRVSGYLVVERDDSDPTLKHNRSGLKVIGRGGLHQIDAIADFAVAQPFSYPQRLLVEAKCYSDTRRVGIDIIRKAIGVLKDVGEYWVTQDKDGSSISTMMVGKPRYHYQYALFSASGYTSEAEKYAYAHDIYLIPLAGSRYIQPIITAIRHLDSRSFGAQSRDAININMTQLRRAIREGIRNPRHPGLTRAVGNQELAFRLLDEFCRLCHQMNGAALAMIEKRFPLFLVPSPDLNIAELRDVYKVSIHWDIEGRWYLRSVFKDRILFSFDLPRDLFELYAEEGVLSPKRALDLKAEYLSSIQATIMLDGRIRIITFQLDREWLVQIRERLSQMPRRLDQGGMTLADG
ncbi:MAG: hypothetical protein ACE5IO_01465 [Thermoplasmata archaeon]